MKKMTIVFAAILFAMGVNAAAVDWSASNMASQNGNAYQLFVIGQNGVTTLETVTALLDQGQDTSSYAFASGTVTSGKATVVDSGLTLGVGTYTSFMVIFDNATATSADQYVVLSGAANQTQTVGESTAKITFSAGNGGTKVNNASNWKSYGDGVPEPTSGLLLLMGGALLALRRKQK